MTQRQIFFFFIATSPHNYKKLPDLQLKIGELRINPSEKNRIWVYCSIGI